MPAPPSCSAAVKRHLRFEWGRFTARWCSPSLVVVSLGHSSKRSKSFYVRFAAEMPKEARQSDFQSLPRMACTTARTTLTLFCDLRGEEQGTQGRAVEAFAAYAPVTGTISTGEARGSVEGETVRVPNCSLIVTKDVGAGRSVPLSCRKHRSRWPCSRRMPG